MSNKNQSPILNWPENPDGEPLKQITTSAQETIPTAPYANITIFASVTEFVEDKVEGIKQGQIDVENGLADVRKDIEEELDKDDK